MQANREEHKQMIKKITCIFLVVFLMVGFVLQSFADQLSDAQKELKQTEADKAKIQKQIQQKEKDIQYRRKKRDEVVKELEQLGLEKEQIELQIQLLESAIQSLDDAIAKAEQEYDEMLELLKARLRVMYKKTSTIWQLDELLKSKSINELFMRARMMKQIAENDQRLLDNIEKKQLEIEELKSQRQYELDNCVEEAKQYALRMEEKEISRANYDRDINADKKELKKYEEQEKQLEEESKEWEELIKQIQKSGSAYRGGDLVWPMPTNRNIYSYYGNRLHPIYKVWKMHTGIDIGAALNEAIVAAGNGTVIYAGSKGGYGNTIIIDHGGGITTLYAHINKGGILVKEGQEVKAGQKIAKAGKTGTATGPHCHFEVRKNGETQNPLEYVKQPD